MNKQKNICKPKESVNRRIKKERSNETDKRKNGQAKEQTKQLNEKNKNKK